MRVYHFRSSEFGLKCLSERRLKISLINELNDPFEFLGADLSDKTFRTNIKNQKKSESKKTGVLCFSEDWKNPVQWSHYAENHKGICLGFDIPDRLLHKVEYVDQRMPALEKPSSSLHRSLLTTKFSHWAYEREWRQFIELELNQPENGVFYLDFSDDLKLSQVILGCRSRLIPSQVKNTLKSLRKTTHVFESRIDFSAFEVVRNHSPSTGA